MQDTQEFLNTLTILFVLAIATLILLDFFAGLVNLWIQLNKQKIQVVNSLPHTLEPKKTTTLPYLKPINKFVHTTPEADYTASTTANSVDTESLILLIQKLPQSRIRTAARRLGIGDKVDGKYQKLGILRTQLKVKLQSQPMEVAQVLEKLKVQVSTER